MIHSSLYRRPLAARILDITPFPKRRRMNIFSFASGFLAAATITIVLCAIWPG